MRCLFAGLLGLLAAVALLAVIAAGLAGYWQMEHHHARATLALVAAAAALLVLVQVDWQARWALASWWMVRTQAGDLLRSDARM